MRVPAGDAPRAPIEPQIAGDLAGDGLILCDKPVEVSSHDVVAATRRALSSAGAGRRRVGHAGTLDPFASGLLVVLVGRATRIQRFVMALPKTYEVVAQLGARSSTGDPEGEIEHTGALPPDPPPLPSGKLSQRPPAYSAIKVGGERAYRRARRGEHVELPEREVEVHEFRQLWRQDDRAGFRIVCSAGTYVRSLIADLGDAYCLELRRTRVGPFDVRDADGRTLIALEQALDFLPERRLDAAQAARAVHGAAVEDPGGAGELPVGAFARLTDERGLLAVAQLRAGGELKPVVGLRASVR